MKEFIEDESGLTAVEYAIAGGVVVGGMAGAFTLLGQGAEGQMDGLCGELDGGVTANTVNTTC
ncbi:Flp family type IVb pilin [Thalassotalea crassostreae]|uniref:Flp family type IVb pilin n=1 Tax=Thalassotalea crassostreae TaxID=1763536 RepID=UPI001D05021F|nr:Flp family type IVb pilin [Thalassotalea crassostreae]